MSVNIILTNAGRDALINASNNGTRALTLSHIAFGHGAYTPDPNQTTLVDEFKRLAVMVDTEENNPYTIMVGIVDESNDSYSVSEFGLYTDDGILFAVFSTTTGMLLQKTELSVLTSSFFITFSSADIGNISFSKTLKNCLPVATQDTFGLVKIWSDGSTLYISVNGRSSCVKVFEQVEYLQEYQETVADGHWETGSRTVAQGYWATGKRTVSSGYYKTETYYETQQCKWYNTYSMQAQNTDGKCFHTSCWYSCNGFEYCDYWTNECQAGSTSSFYKTIQVAKTRQVWVDTSYTESYQYYVDTGYTESYQYWVDTSYQVTKFRTVTYSF